MRPKEEPLLGPGVASNEAILRSTVRSELDQGAVFLEQRLGRMFSGMAGMLLNPLAGLAYRAVGRDEILKRAMGQFDAVVWAAKRHPAMPEAIFDGPLTAYLKHEEAYTRANRRHPKYPELEGLVREVYVARVESVSLLLHQGQGASYPDLLRSVFPTRLDAQRVLEREFLYADRLMTLAHQEQSLLQAPPLVRNEVFQVLREAYEWYKMRMDRSLHEVWGHG